MVINQAPPLPQPASVPAQVETISAADAQRLASPEQSVINDINSGKYGNGFTASMPSSQQAKDLQKSVEGILEGAGKLGGARSKGEEVIARDNALRGPGYTDRPPKQSGNKAIADMKAKSANRQQTAPQSRQNKGIAAARQKSLSGQSGASQTSGSGNKGISSFKNRASGQSSSASNGSSSGASKGGQSR